MNNQHNPWAVIQQQMQQQMQQAGAGAGVGPAPNPTGFPGGGMPMPGGARAGQLPQMTGMANAANGGMPQMLHLPGMANMVGGGGILVLVHSFLCYVEGCRT